MSERDTLLHWLDRAAARVRLGRLVRDAGWLICAMIALLALHQWLHVIISAPVVRAALLPFLVFAALTTVAVFLVRRWRGPTRAEAAAAADTRAGLKDELRSALWFAHPTGVGAAAQLLLGRAARTVQALDARRVFPLTIPRNLVAVAALTVLAVTIPWMLPQPGASAAADSAVASASAPRAAVAPSPPRVTPPVGPDESPPAQMAEGVQAAWSQIEALAVALAGEADTDEVERAIAARDARSAARLLQALQQRQAAQARPPRAARPETEQMSDTLAARILERLQDLMKEEAQAAAGAAAQPDAPTAQLTEQLRADEEAEKGDARGQQSAGENALNEMLRAINRSSIGQREVVSGAGEAAQQAGRSNQGGGAMGRRVSNTQAGAGNGERPKGDPKGDAESEPVLGKKTARIEAQLQRVKIAPMPGEEESSGEDTLYAATRAQAARTSYEVVATRAQRSPENAARTEATPLAYRDAVKRYTLEQHDAPTRP